MYENRIVTHNTKVSEYEKYGMKRFKKTDGNTDNTIHTIKVDEKKTTDGHTYKMWSCFRTSKYYDNTKRRLWYITFKPLYGTICKEIETKTFVK